MSFCIFYSNSLHGSLQKLLKKYWGFFLRNFSKSSFIKCIKDFFWKPSNPFLRNYSRDFCGKFVEWFLQEFAREFLIFFLLKSRQRFIRECSLEIASEIFPGISSDVSLGIFPEISYRMILVNTKLKLSWFSSEVLPRVSLELYPWVFTEIHLKNPSKTPLCIFSEITLGARILFKILQNMWKGNFR